MQYLLGIVIVGLLVFVGIMVLIWITNKRLFGTIIAGLVAFAGTMGLIWGVFECFSFIFPILATITEEHKEHWVISSIIFVTIPLLVAIYTFIKTYQAKPKEIIKAYRDKLIDKLPPVEMAIRANEDAQKIAYKRYSELQANLAKEEDSAEIARIEYSIQTNDEKIKGFEEKYSKLLVERKKQKTGDRAIIYTIVDMLDKLDIILLGRLE